MKRDELADSTLSTFTAGDGENVAVQDWPLAPGVALRGVVIIVHGLGEHAGRHELLARRLNAWGFAVRGYDHYGHGESDGRRGGMPPSSRLLDDLADQIDSTRARMAPQVPLIVLGHSMGGLVAACLLALRRADVQGLVLSSPALDLRLTTFQKMLLATLGRIAPDFVVGNGLDPAFLSHDPAVATAYRADPKVHDRVSGRLARFMAGAGRLVLERAPGWTVPTLLLYAGADRLVNPEGSRAFAAAAPAHVVSAHCFQGMYHEIFKERGAREVFQALRGWLDERFTDTWPPQPD